MTPTNEAVTELNTMLDEGVTVELADGVKPGEYRLQVVLADEGCADCLVPDDTLRMIATDALQRRGVEVTSLRIEHAPV